MSRYRGRVNVSLELTGWGEGADLSGTQRITALGDSESGKIHPLQDGWVRAGAGQRPWGRPSMRQANSDFKIVVTKRRKERKRWD